MELNKLSLENFKSPFIKINNHRSNNMVNLEY